MSNKYLDTDYCFKKNTKIFYLYELQFFNIFQNFECYSGLFTLENSLVSFFLIVFLIFKSQY